MSKENEQLESLLRQGLDRVADLGEEAPPNLADLQMLVAKVQAAQEQQLHADLQKFWAVAAVLLATTLFAFMRSPATFVLFQGTMGILSLVGAGIWYAWRKQVAE